MRTKLYLAIAVASALASIPLNATPDDSTARGQEQTASKHTAGRELVRALGESRLIDLTHSFDERTIYWPTEKGFVLEKGQAGRTREERSLSFRAANDADIALIQAIQLIN